MKITKAQLRDIIKEELTNEVRQAATGTEDEVQAEIDEILALADMTPMDALVKLAQQGVIGMGALVILAQQGVIDITLDLGMFLKE